MNSDELRKMADECADEIRREEAPTYACRRLAESVAAACSGSQRWIPVGERLPERGVRVLVLETLRSYQHFRERGIEGNSPEAMPKVCIGVLHRGRFAGEVSHWMPLPPPPSEDQPHRRESGEMKRDGA